VREIARNISAGLHDQQRFNLPLMTAALRKLGLRHREIALARSLVGEDLVGEMMTGDRTISQARQTLEEDAHRLHLPAKDLLRLHQAAVSAAGPGDERAMVRVQHSTGRRRPVSGTGGQCRPLARRHAADSWALRVLGPPGASAIVTDEDRVVGRDSRRRPVERTRRRKTVDGAHSASRRSSFRRRPSPRRSFHLSPEFIPKME
jgi:hypothetical protein